MLRRCQARNSSGVPTRPSSAPSSLAIGNYLEHEKVVFPVILYKIVLPGKTITSLRRFLYDHILLDTMIFTVAVAIYDADMCSAAQ